MKQTHITSALLILLFAFLATSCKKDDPEPTLGDQVAGDYTMTKIGLSGLFLELPYNDPTDGTQTSGKIKVTKITDDSASATLTLSEKDKTGKVTNQTSSLGTATLQKATTGEIEIYVGTNKAGTYKEGEVTILGYSQDLGNVTFVGKKN